MKSLALLPAAALALAASPALAWGQLGHAVTALIAYRHLTPTARAKLDALLASDPDTLTAPDFASRASWADRYRNDHRETAMWHFVDIEVDHPDLNAACFNFPKLAPGQPASAGPAQDCVVNKIDEFGAELADPATAPAERLLALKFLIHFVGDLHQPLHAIDHEDHGGNCVQVQQGPGGASSNLHSYWDTGVVERMGRSPEAIAAKLDAEITPGDVRAWTTHPDGSEPSLGAAARSWAGESYNVGRTVTYALPSLPHCGEHAGPDVLSPAYEAKAEEAAAVQLERAGVRLAWALNAALR